MQRVTFKECDGEQGGCVGQSREVYGSDAVLGRDRMGLSVFLVAIKVGWEVVVLEEKQGLALYVRNMVLVGKADHRGDLVERKCGVSFTTVEAVRHPIKSI